MTRFLLVAVLVAVGMMMVACGSSGSGSKTCVPGESVACVGAGGCAGGQMCNAEGSGFGACDCGSTADAGHVDAGHGDGGVDGGSPEGGARDAGGDAGPCDPVMQTGCGATGRCTWVMDDGGTQLACVADGTLDVHSSCSVPPSGSDDCRRGLICSGGSCERICDPTAGPTACPTHFTCGPGLGDAGVCEATCDPVRQTRGYDGAAACGSTDPSSPSLGCFGAPNGPFTCGLNSFPDRTYGMPGATTASGAPYVNACAAGFMPFYPNSMGIGEIICLPLCEPVASWAGNDGGRYGMSPYTCADRGATGSTVECRFLDALDRMSIDGPEVGVCFDTMQYSSLDSCSTVSMSDADGNGTPDYIDQGCGPWP